MVTGMAHLVINLNDWKGTTPFYRCLLANLGLTIVAGETGGVQRVRGVLMLHHLFKAAPSLYSPVHYHAAFMLPSC